MSAHTIASPAQSPRRRTVVDLHKHKGHEPLVMVTAYDASQATWAEAAGIDVVLVGDSLGVVIQGASNTLGVTLDASVYHTRCVNAGLRSCHLVADMPFLSYQTGTKEALLAAGRLLSEGGAQSVKMEGGREIASTVERLVQAGIPVMAHVGLMPQRVHALGGYRQQGRDHSSAQRIRDDADALVAAGAYAVLMEHVPAELGAELTEALPVPTIGIGAGTACDGQVLVLHDLLGLTPGTNPPFAPAYATLFAAGQKALERYADDVRARRLGRQALAGQGSGQ